MDVYSIDEAFLDFTGIDRVVSYEDFGREVKNTVCQNVGLPVCVGIAPTRTLAKLANFAAKKYPATGGVVDLKDPARQRRLMARVPAPKKQIMCSRSFGQPLQQLSDLEEAVAHFATRATEKLRGGQQYAGELMVFIRTNPFKTTAAQYSRGASVKLIQPSQDSRVIVQQTLHLLRPMYREGFDYAKAGVMLGELLDESVHGQRGRTCQLCDATGAFVASVYDLLE